MKRVLAWVVPVAAAAAVAPIARGDGGDAWLFVRAGKVLLSADWSRAFANPGVQAGPLQLALFGTVGRVPVLMAIVLGVTAALLVLVTARAAGVEQPRLLVGVGLAAVATGFTRSGFDTGHPADSLLPLLWILAAVEARRGRTVRAGLIVGLSAGLETWGILGIAVLALAPSMRNGARGFVVAVGAAAVLFVPFVAAGHFEMSHYRWAVSSESLLSLVVAHGSTVGWPLRMAQGALALAVGVAVARVARNSRHAVWLVPGAIVVVRLLLDPLDSGYYFVGIEGPALVGLALAAEIGLLLPGRRFAREPLA